MGAAIGLEIAQERRLTSSVEEERSRLCIGDAHPLLEDPTLPLSVVLQMLRMRGFGMSLPLTPGAGFADESPGDAFRAMLP